MAAYQLHGLRPPTPPRPHRPISAPPPPCRARPPLASLRTPAPPPPLPKKRVSGATETNREAAAAVLEEEGNEAREEAQEEREEEEYVESVGVGESAGLPAHLRAARVGLGDPLFFLLTFVAVTTSVAFTSMVAVAIPTMLAMRRAANSFTMLADAVLEELPSMMAAVRLSGMEISDLTLELSDLSQEIADGVNKSTKIVQAVEDGIGQMRNMAQQQTTSMIEERANLRTIPTAGPAKRSNESSSRQGRRQKGPIN